jgi:hypothetical protein
MKTRSIFASMALFALLAGCNADPVTDETTVDTETETDTTTDVDTRTDDDAMAEIDAEGGELFTAEDLNFSITIPADWNGITSVEKDTTWSFGTAKTVYIQSLDGVEIFAVTMFTEEQWDSLKDEEGPKPTLIVGKDDFIWAYDQTQDPTGVEMQVYDLAEVLESFEVNR